MGNKYSSFRNHQLFTMTVYDIIHIKNIEAFSKSGVFEAEKVLGQTFLIDVDLYISPADLASAHHDNIERTIDYSVVSSTVREYVKDNPSDLIEAMAHNLARMIIDKFTLCMGVEITVSKPYIPVEGFSGDVSVTTKRFRK